MRETTQRIFRLAAVAALALLAGRPVAAQPAALAGAVVASDTRGVVANAVVSVAGTSRSAVTDANGRFRFDAVPTGDLTLVVTAQGFLEARVAGVRPASAAQRGLVIEIDPTPNFMDRVQVTGSKTPLSIGDLAAQADIVDQRTIQSRGDQEITQALANVPGLIVAGQAGSFESIMLRGLPRDGNEFTSTLLLVDGVPQVDSRNSGRMINLPIYDADSIEVVRGPNSALYGRTAVGGSINVRTANPTAEHQGEVDFVRGGYNMARAVVRGSGPISDWGGYYLSAALDRNEGYYVGDPTFEIVKTGLFGKLTFVPDDRSFGSLSFNRVLSDNSTPTNVPIIDGHLLSDIDPAFDRLRNMNISGTNYHQAEKRVTLNYTRQLTPSVEAVGVFGYRAIQYQFIDDGDFIGSPFDRDAHTLTMYPFDQQTDEDIFYQEGRLEMTPRLGGLKNSVVVGVSYEHNSGTNAGHFIYTDEDLGGWSLDYRNPVIPARNTWQTDAFGGRHYTVGSTGVFGQLSVEPTPRWVLTAGGRLDRLALGNTATQLEGAPKTEDVFTAFSPKLSATYRLLGPETDAGRALNVYGTYSQAFLPPRRPSDLVPKAFVVDLQPEDIANYEAGLKGLFMDQRLSVEASYFWMTRDGIVTNVHSGPFFIPTNAGEHKYKGLETGAAYAVRPDLSFYANASFYRNRFGDFVIESSGGDTVLTGNRLPIAPDAVVNAGATFTPMPRIEATVNIKHVGEVALDQGNTFTLDPYTLVDVAGTWRFRALRLTLSAHNLFNSEYFWSGDTSSGETADPGRPRQVLLTTSVTFK